ncbi:MAG: beta-galactosidase, partial [Muribaculaceae bacterium]|nr:beta-galactosidase [Muribaculaceae bacterium]
IGVNKAAESPEDADFEQAAVYTISNIPAADEREHTLLRIDYRGDVARLYCDGKLIADNFYNGRPMLYGLWRLPENATKLELRILPLQENMPVYFPEEANTTSGEEVVEITIIPSE